MRRRLALLFLYSVSCMVGAAEAGQTSSNTRRRLERLAKEATHFATGDIVSNRWSEPRRWPPGLLEAHQHLLDELRAVMNDRDALRALLGDDDPRLRTLALGGLFIREDPQDLPLIAQLMSDKTATLPRLGMAATSMGGRLPLTAFESPQTVGSVAQAMIRFYLHATERAPFQVQAVSSGPQPEVPPSLFGDYWSERRSRLRCASWFLVRMRRATRQTSPLQPQYEADVRRVLAEISALRPIERAWTLLFVRTDQGQIDGLVPDAALVTALQAVGSDALMTFLRREPPTDDPDVLAGPVFPGSRTGFILDHAPQLLRATDADAVLASAEAYRALDNNTRFVAAAARLRGLQDVERATDSLKADIQRIPIARTLGPRDQAVLAFALWQMRGAAERAFLANWLYAALPFPGPSNDLESFFRSVEKEGRPDTSLLLAALVTDARFEQMEWSPLARIIEMVNQTLPSPLVDRDTLYNYMPSSRRPDQAATLATWRRLLRRHFGVVR